MADSQSQKTEQIWRDFSERLRSFVRSRVTSSVDVDDIVQTVFLRIHSRMDQLRDADRIESWLFQIARNAVADHFRRRQRIGGEGRIEDGGSSQFDVPTLREEKNANSEVAGCLAAFVERLPKEQRRAVALFELAGVAQAKIAEIESISLSGAKSRIQRGRRNLKTMLRECCQFEFDARGNVMECSKSDGGPGNCCPAAGCN